MIVIFLVCALMLVILFFFFFKQKTAYEMRISDWSLDVCSSDLILHDTAPLQSLYKSFKGYLTAFHAKNMSTIPPTIAQNVIRAIFTLANLCKWFGFDSPGTSQIQPFRTRSEEHTSELQSLMRISYDVFG